MIDKGKTCTTVDEAVFDFFGLPPCVQGYRHRPYGKNGFQSYTVFRVIPHRDGHSIARLHSQIYERFCKGHGFALHLTEGQTLVFIN